MRHISMVALSATAAVALAGLMLKVAGGPAPRPIPVMVQGHEFPLVVSPDGHYLAATSPRVDAISLYDLRTGRIRLLTTTGVTQFYRYGMSCYALAFSPDSRTLADGGAEYGSARSINTWDTATGTHRATILYTSSVGTSLCYTPDGRYLLAADRDRHVHVLDARTGRILRSLPGPGGDIASLALSPDGRRVATGGIVPTCAVSVCDLRTGRLIWTQPVTMPDGVVPSLAFSPDGRTLARGGQSNIITLYDARTGRVRARLSDPPPASLMNWAGNDAAREVGFSPDGRFLVGGGEFRVVVWSARTRRVVLRPATACAPFAFLPGGPALVATQTNIPGRVGPKFSLMFPRRRNGNVAVWPL